MKHRRFFLYGAAAVMMAALVQPGFAQSKTYKVGDVGPAGGIICYTDGTACLEAAPADTEFKTTWARAKSGCEALTVNGVSGWHLPTKDELNWMYLNLKKNGVGGFSNDCYWSSSSDYSDAAWGQSFFEGDQYDYLDTTNASFLVRAVRSLPALVQPGAAQGKVYQVGDTGPAGGIICYTDGKRHLEAAPAKTEFRAAWAQAKSRCEALTVNGVGGWHLPTKDELGWMYMNLKKKGTGGFGNDIYWSSSAEYSDVAWYQDFRDGSQFEIGEKIEAHSVRAVRSFSACDAGAWEQGLGTWGAVPRSLSIKESG